ncbi:MAG TPA: SCO family protein [Verrucomicrobiae bacterium]|nr:SCO family protein [Verrucomicrobiae bacterium]
MQDASPRLSRTIWIGVALVVLLMAFAFLLSGLKGRQRASHVRPTGSGAEDLATTGQIADFTLTNQANQPVKLADLRGKVWVADIIFSRCAGPCPRMTRQMASLQAALPKDSSARLVTLTTDPDFDTPEVLARYAKRFNAETNRWWFLTGDKKEIAALATEGLKLTGFLETKPEDRLNPADLFIHSTLFVIVDKQARLRGVIETDSDSGSWTNLQAELVETIRTLEREK